MRLFSSRSLLPLLFFFVALPDTSGALYIKTHTSSPVTAFNHFVRGGTNIWIEYQDSDFWYLTRSRSDKPITKQAADLVPRVSYDPPLTGTNHCAKNLYDIEPAEYVSSNIGQTTIKSGLGTSSRIKVYYKEDNLYAVSFDNENEPTGRTEVSCIAVTASADTKQHEDSVPSLPWTATDWLYVILPCAAVAVFLAVMLGIRKRLVDDRPENKAARAKETELKERFINNRNAMADIMPLINKRFPSHQIFRVPDSVRIVLDRRADKQLPVIDEDYPDRWQLMLDRYPDPPRTERERLEREEAFWKRYASFFSVEMDGAKPELKPKPYIIDYFKSWEKWIFRDYFAATGVVHDTVARKMCVAVMDVEDAHNMKTFGDNTSLSNNQKRAAIEKSQDAEKRFVRDELPQHMETWGGWFFVNIQDAFKKQHEPNPGHGPTSPVSPPGQNVQNPTGWIPNA